MRRYRVRTRRATSTRRPVVHAHHTAIPPPARSFERAESRRSRRLDCRPPEAVDRTTSSTTSATRCTYRALERARRARSHERRASSRSRARAFEPDGRAGHSAGKKSREQLRRDRALLRRREFCFDSPLVRAHPQLADYAEPTFTAGSPVRRRGRRAHSAHLRRVQVRAAGDRCEHAARAGAARTRGVCQDFAHLAVGCLRSLGLAARYVSGYLETKPPPGRPRLVGADASHAWASVYVPGFGWLDFDPTNDVIPGDRHVTRRLGPRLQRRRALCAASCSAAAPSA